MQASCVYRGGRDGEGGRKDGRLCRICTKLYVNVTPLGWCVHCVRFMCVAENARRRSSLSPHEENTLVVVVGGLFLVARSWTCVCLCLYVYVI